MTSGNHCLANQKTRVRLDPVIAAIPEGKTFKSDTLAIKMRNRRDQLTTSTVGNLLAERNDVQSLGEGLWQKLGAPA